METYYAAIGNNKKDVEKSSSGGVFFVLAKKIIKENGVVCGAAFSENLKVKHIIVDSLSGLERLRGSKYVQSEMGNTLRDIESILKSGKVVLFSGTACQIKALYAFLQSQGIQNRDNLISVEILCHGVPSPGIFSDYIHNWKCGLKTDIVDYQFRAKNLGRDFIIRVQDSEEKIKYLNALTDPFYAAFLNNSILRPSCYECKFCGTIRDADITLGDFWGIEKARVNNKLKKGCSLVICNSSKGEHLFEQGSSELNFQKIEKKIAIEKQPQLKVNRRQEIVPSNRKELFQRWKKDSSSDFFSYLRKCSINKKKILFNFLPKRIKLLNKMIA